MRSASRMLRESLAVAAAVAFAPICLAQSVAPAPQSPLDTVGLRDLQAKLVRDDSVQKALQHSLDSLLRVVRSATAQQSNAKATILRYRATNDTLVASLAINAWKSLSGFAAGAQAVTSNTSAMSFGMEAGLLTTPFINPDAVNAWDRWGSRLTFQAVGTSLALVVAKNVRASPQTIAASGAAGLALGNVIGAITGNSDSEKRSKRIGDLVSTIAFNRLAYYDVRKLLARITALHDGDATLARAVLDYQAQAAFGELAKPLPSSDAVRSIPNLEQFVDSSMALVVRCQSRIRALDAIYADAAALQQRYLADAEYSKPGSAVRSQLDKVSASLSKARRDWSDQAELFFKLTDAPTSIPRDFRRAMDASRSLNAILSLMP